MSSLSISWRIAEVELNLKCVEALIVRALKALHGSDGDVIFARTSNATPEGIKALERQLESLLAQKVQHLEEKLALQEEQRRLSQPAACGVGIGGAPAAAAAPGAAAAAAASSSAVACAAAPASTSTPVCETSHGESRGGHNDAVATSAGAGAMSTVSSTVVAAPSSRPQATQSSAAARVAQPSLDGAAASSADPGTASSSAASASQASQAAAAAAGVGQSAQDDTAASSVGTGKEYSVSTAAVAAVSPSPPAAQATARAGVVQSATDGVAAASVGTGEVSSVPPAAIEAASTPAHAAQATAPDGELQCVQDGDAAASAGAEAMSSPVASAASQVVQLAVAAARVVQEAQLPLPRLPPPPATAEAPATAGGGSAGTSLELQAKGDDYRGGGWKVSRKERSAVGGTAAAVPEVADNPGTVQSSNKTAPHYNGAALKAAKAAAAAANARPSTAASKSAPKPRIPVASSASTLQAAPPLCLAATPSLPSGGGPFAVSPGSTATPVVSPSLGGERVMESAVARVGGSSSPGSTTAPKGKGKARGSHLGPGSAAAPKGKGKAWENPTPTIASSQVAPGASTASPAVAKIAAKRKRQDKPAHAQTAGSSSGGIQKPRATRGNTKKARMGESNPFDRELCGPAWMPFHNMVVMAGRLYGTPEQKKVAVDQLNKLATADAQISGRNAVAVAADLAAKLASTARRDVKKEVKDAYTDLAAEIATSSTAPQETKKEPQNTDAKTNSPRHAETQEEKGDDGVFFGRVMMADVCSRDAILSRYLLGDVKQLIAGGYNPSKLIASGFKALIEKCRPIVLPPGFQLRSWDECDKDKTCVFSWTGPGAS